MLPRCWLQAKPQLQATKIPSESKKLQLYFSANQEAKANIPKNTSECSFSHLPWNISWSAVWVVRRCMLEIISFIFSNDMLPSNIKMFVQYSGIFKWTNALCELVETKQWDKFNCLFIYNITTYGPMFFTHVHTSAKVIREVCQWFQSNTLSPSATSPHDINTRA